MPSGGETEERNQRIAMEPRELPSFEKVPAVHENKMANKQRVGIVFTGLQHSSLKHYSKVLSASHLKSKAFIESTENAQFSSAKSQKAPINYRCTNKKDPLRSIRKRP